MSYATNADIEERLGTALYIELTDDAASGVADEDKVTEARLAAEAEIDSYLGRRWLVPVDVTGQPGLAAMLKRLTLDLAEYRLRARRLPVPEDAVSVRDAAVLWLTRAAKGDVSLPSAIEPPVNPASGAAGAAVGRPRVLDGEEWDAI